MVQPGRDDALARTQLAAAAHFILPRIDLEDQGSNLNPLVGDGPISGGNGGDAGELVTTPNFYYIQPVGERSHSGLGTNAPFGLTAEYDDDWIGGYHAIKSELLTININPNFAYRISDVRYQPDPTWSYRLGEAFDETPVTSVQRRAPRLPDEDRLWLALDASYSPIARVRVDVGYAHVFVDDASIDNTLESKIPTTSHTLRDERRRDRRPERAAQLVPVSAPCGRLQVLRYPIQERDEGADLLP